MSTYVKRAALIGCSLILLAMICVALLPDSQLDRIAARWIDLIDCEECEVEPDDKPMLRELAGDLIDVCRRAEGAEDVLFAWSI